MARGSKAMSLLSPHAVARAASAAPVITKYWICYGVLVHGERTSAATTLIAAPPTPVLVANLHLHLLLLFLGHLRHLPLLLHSGFSIPGAATSCVRGVL